ncbi:MAG: type II toxin-antitoxin system RelE/ParE family toxin [Acidiferrobacter sp.]
MTWRVETLNLAVDQELAALPVSLRARLLRIAELIEVVGLPNIHAPHVKHVEGKLWEMRAKGANGIARAIYVAVTGQRIVIVHVFVKMSQKTPTKALELARHRAKEI